jgi:hypothetical protein
MVPEFWLYAIISNEIWLTKERGVLMKNKKETSNMDNVGLIKKIDDIPELKNELIAVFECKSKMEISCYGLLLMQHVLSLSNVQPCDAINQCIEVSRRWQEGEATYQDTRQAAAMIPDLARTEKDPVKAKVLRVMGQVTLIPHVKRHALIDSDYAITLINLMYPKNLEEVRKERKIQIELMKSV